MNYHALTAIPEMGQYDREISRRVAVKKKLKGTTAAKLVRRMERWRGAKLKFYDKIAKEQDLTSKYIARIICEYKKNH